MFGLKQKDLDALVPGIAGLAVLSTTFTALAYNVVFLREEGVLKRVVSNKAAKEMILRFAEEREIETSYAAWRLGTPTPYSRLAPGDSVEL